MEARTPIAEQVWLEVRSNLVKWIAGAVTSIVLLVAVGVWFVIESTAVDFVVDAIEFRENAENTTKSDTGGLWAAAWCNSGEKLVGGNCNFDAGNASLQTIGRRQLDDPILKRSGISIYAAKEQNAGSIWLCGWQFSSTQVHKAAAICAVPRKVKLRWGWLP